MGAKTDRGREGKYKKRKISLGPYYWLDCSNTHRLYTLRAKTKF